MASATAFLDKYVADTQDEEDQVVTTPKKEEEEVDTTPIESKVTEEKAPEPTEDSSDFLSKYVKEEAPVAVAETKSELQKAIETQPTQEVKAEKGSSVEGAQSLLGGLLSSLQQGAQQKQEEIIGELKQTAETIPTETEAYKTLEEQAKTYFGQSIGDLPAKEQPDTVENASTAQETSRPTKFLDQYIGDISSAIQGGAQDSLSNLLGKPVVSSGPAPTIYETFKQNIGNAQNQAIAAAQQAGNSGLADTTKYTVGVSDPKLEQAYFQPPVNVAVTPSPTAGKVEAKESGVTLAKSNPTPINISSLSSGAQTNLENMTGISKIKQDISKSIANPNSSIETFTQNTANKSLSDSSTIEKVGNAGVSAFASLPSEQREKAGNAFLSSFIGKTSDFINGFTQLGSSVSNVWSTYMKPIGDRLGNGLDQLSVVTGEPASWFINYLTNSGKDMVTEADVGLPFLFGLDRLLNQPQNKNKIANLKPGEAATVYLGGASGGDEYRVAMAMGESAVVYKDENGNLRITDTKDKDGNSTIKDGKYTGKPGVYMFDRGEGGSYKVDAAGLPGASDVLDAMEKLGIPRKEFSIDIAVGASPESVAKQVLKGVTEVIKYAIPALYSASLAKDALTEGLTEKAKGAKQLLETILNNMNLPYPFEGEEDLTDKEWLYSGMWSAPTRGLSTAQANELVDWLYGSASIQSALKAAERYPWWQSAFESLFGTGPDYKWPGQSYSLPVQHKFAKESEREKIMSGGTLTSGPVWFHSYLRRNPKLLGIESTTKEQWDKEKVFKAAQNAIGNLFQEYLNSINDATKTVNWGDVMNNVANAAGRTGLGS